MSNYSGAQEFYSLFGDKFSLRGFSMNASGLTVSGIMSWVDHTRGKEYQVTRTVTLGGLNLPDTIDRFYRDMVRMVLCDKSKSPDGSEE